MRLVCCGQAVLYPKERKGKQRIRYRHYLLELAKKPQALRQVAPELVRELGAPYGKLWAMLAQRYGEKEAARVFSRIFQAAVDHGEELVGRALQAALSQGRFDLLTLAEHLEDRQGRSLSVAVPEALSGYCVESANATDYDRLLGSNGGGA